MTTEDPRVPDGAAATPTAYIPNTDADQATMLARLGLASADELFADIAPDRRDPPIDLPRALAELELSRLFDRLAADNEAARMPSFLGAGSYRRFVPAVAAHLASRPEFVTAYTPYQPEISQGTLQAAFEYQSTVCELTGMEVSNTGLYDLASAAAEACLMAARITGRGAIALVEPLDPNVVDVVRTYAYGAGLDVEVAASLADVDDRHAAVLAQQPDFLGAIVDLEELCAAARAAGALSVVATDPFTLGMLRPPGDAGADIVVGEGRDLAGPPTFGGPSLGLFASRERHVRQMPGRIVGRTLELAGTAGQAPRVGYVLTLQAREQFIRRERATSNFSTGQALVALAFTIAVQALGPAGLRRANDLCYQAAHEAARRVAAVPGFEVVERGPWFQEFLVRGPLPPSVLAEHLAERGIVGGLPLEGRPEPEARDAMLVCVTEATPPEDVDALIEALTAIAQSGGAA